MKQFRVTDRFTKRETISANKYFNEVSSRRVLTIEEEQELTLKMVAGDEAAREKIIEANLRFVVSVAKAYAGAGLPIEDIISAGNYGLVEASKKFDPNRGFKFISFAVWYIRKEINKLLDDNSRIVRLPSNRLKIVRTIHKITNDYLLNENREPTFEEIIDELSTREIIIDKSTLVSIFNADRFGVPLEGNSDSEEELLFPIQYLSNTEEKTDEKVLNDSLKEVILFGLKQLKPGERDIVMMRHGLYGKDELSFKEIAEYYDVCPETIRLRYRHALRRIKFALYRAKFERKNYYE